MDNVDNQSSEPSESSDELENLEDVERLVVRTSSKTPPTPQVKKASETPSDRKEVSRDGEEKWQHGVEEVARDDTLSQRTEDTLDDVSSKDKSDLASMEEEGEEVKKEEERRKRMKILLTGYLELKTKKETERAMLNEKKITSQWLYPFRGAYQKEWGLEMKKLKLSFQKALDYKKSHIHAIQRERKLVELNHLWADSAHQRISEELFDFMRARCNKLKMEYLEELEETKKYYLEREKEIVDRFSKAEERGKVLGLMRRTVRDKTLQRTREALQNFKHEGEFLKAQEMDAIKEKHLTYVEMIARELQSSVSPPEHKMDEIRSLFEEWKGKYEDFLRVSEKNRKELEKFGEELPSLEAKVAAAKKTLEDLRAENNETKQKQSEEIMRLQKKAKECELLSPSLRKMISESEDVMGKLRERKTKLDRIIKLKKMCDQLETDGDKLFPQGDFLDPSEEQQIEEADCSQLVSDLCSEDVEDPNLMRNLHHKLSRVKLQNQFLQHDIDNLRIEGMALRNDMKKYLHLIASGDWQRIPDSKLREFSEGEDRNEVDRSCPKGSESVDCEDRVEMNLRLLDMKCGKMNERVIKQAEKM